MSDPKTSALDKSNQRINRYLTVKFRQKIVLDDGREGTLSENQIVFLKAYRKTGSVARACMVTGRHRVTHSKWLKTNEFYRSAFDEMTAELADDLEEAARARAIDGCRQIKFTKHGDPLKDPRKHDADGNVLPEWEHDPWYYETTYSDRLLELLLRAKKPEEYRERSSVELSGAGGGAIEVEAVRRMALADPVLAQQLNTALEGLLNEQQRLGSADAHGNGVPPALGVCDQQGAISPRPASPLHQREADGFGGGPHQPPDGVLPASPWEERAVQ